MKPLFEFISEVSISSGRPIDYLTLREDFSQTGSVISTQERDELKIIFEWIKNQCDKKKELQDLYIDYGYVRVPCENANGVAVPCIFSDYAKCA